MSPNDKGNRSDSLFQHFLWLWKKFQQPFSTPPTSKEKNTSSFLTPPTLLWKLSAGCQKLPNVFVHLTQNHWCTFLRERSQLVGVLILQLLVFKSAILKTIQTLRESRKKLPEENVTHFQECEYPRKFFLKI